MILLISFFVLTLGTVWLRLAERNLIQMKYHTGSLVLDNIQSQVQLEWEGRYILVLGESDRRRLLEIIQTFANNLQLKNIFIVSPERRIITHQRLDQVGQPYDDPDVNAAFSRVSKINHYFSATGSSGLHAEDEVQITGPIFLGDQTVGAVRFTLPMNDVISSMEGTRRILFLYLIFTAVVTIIVGSVMLMRLIIRPLDELERATVRITEGNLDHQVAVLANDEIGQLSDSFNQMTVRLKKSLALIRNIVESMPSMLISVDADGTVTQWNTAATRYTGIEAAQAIGRKLWDLTAVFDKYRQRRDGTEQLGGSAVRNQRAEGDLGVHAPDGKHRDLYLKLQNRL